MVARQRRPDIWKCGPEARVPRDRRQPAGRPCEALDLSFEPHDQPPIVAKPWEEALDRGRRQPGALGALRPPERLVRLRMGDFPLSQQQLGALRPPERLARRLLGTPASQGGCVRRWRPLT